MKKLFVLIACLLMISSASQAQNYEKAVGARFGFPAGLTYKQFMSESAAVEIIVGTRGGGASLTALLELHAEALDYSLNVFYGVGGHIGSIDNALNVGVDGIFGLEYTPDAPIVFAIDLKPTLSWWRSDLNFLTGGALSIRYAFQ